MSVTRGDSPSEQRQELVFCHECENEWYKTGPGLTCPACRSDFTEIVWIPHAHHDVRENTDLPRIDRARLRSQS